MSALCIPLQPRLPLTFTMAPLTVPIQRNIRTLPPSRMYLEDVDGARKAQRMQQHT